MRLKKWDVRPIEEANLLNPAFCSLTLTAAIIGFYFQSQKNMPFLMSYLILPIILHQDTRSKLPKRVNTLFAPWIINNYELRINFAERVISTKPFTNEAILMGFNKNLIKIDKDFSIYSPLPQHYIKNLEKRLDNEISEIIHKSYFVGRWLALSGSTETIMTLLGVRP